MLEPARRILGSDGEEGLLKMWPAVWLASGLLSRFLLCCKQ
jgi:hypothetical protein